MSEDDRLPPTVSQLMDTIDFRVVRSNDSAIELPPLDQICIVVEDVDKAVEFYSSSFGWGPWWIGATKLVTTVFEGRQVSSRLKLGLALSGKVEIELIQVLEGDNVLSDFLREKGEGVHHLRFIVDDLEGSVATLAGRGITPKWAMRHFAYLDSDQVGGVVFELLSPGNRRRRQLGSV